MKNFALLICIFSTKLFAQAQPVSTQFDTFINKPSIEWAVYANDTIRFEKSELNKILANRYAKNEIKASLSVISGSAQANSISYLQKDKLDRKIQGPGIRVPVYDSIGNMIRTDIIYYTIDADSFKTTGVTQILYIENGALKSYIPWVAPKMPVITSTGIFLGYSDYFCTAFNFKYQSQPAPKSKIIFLTETKRIINMDSVNAENKLKELYGKNLIQTLWPYILNNKFKIYNNSTGKLIKATDISTDLTNEEKLILPIYDSLGNHIKNVFYKEPLKPDIFTQAELTQKWYYNHSQNLVFNTITAISVYTKKWTANGEDKEASPVLKIVFE